jgi:hypothetical protein
MVPSLIFKLMSSLAFTPGKDFEILDKSIAHVIFLSVPYFKSKVPRFKILGLLL